MPASATRGYTLTEPLLPTAPHSSGPFAARMAARRRVVIREGPRDGGPLPYGPEMLEKSSRVGVDDPAPVLGDESMQNRGVIRLLLAVLGHHSQAGSPDS